jgi:hypothetical protein
MYVPTNTWGFKMMPYLNMNIYIYEYLTTNAAWYSREFLNAFV